MEYTYLCVCVRDVCVCECVLHDFEYNALGHPKPAHRETPRAQLSSAGVVASGTWSASGQRADLFAATISADTGIPEFRFPALPILQNTRNQQMKQRAS